MSEPFLATLAADLAAEHGLEREVILDVRAESGAVYATFTLLDGTEYVLKNEPSSPDQQARTVASALEHPDDYAALGAEMASIGAWIESLPDDFVFRFADH